MENNVQLVVRLNSLIRRKSLQNIKHIDMIFDDGTCPTLEYVQNLLVLQSVLSIKVEKLRYIVKAGLGRTGCLIGAHLIYTHGFTANECIAYMRMIRPGMVVGPQQHWLYHDDFRSWNIQ